MSGETTVWKTVVLYPWLMGIKQGGFLSACYSKALLRNISLLEGLSVSPMTSLGSPVPKLAETCGSANASPS